jgi:hypothetical protein
MQLDTKGRIQRGTLADVLESVVVNRRIDIVSLDPFVKAHSVDENSNSAIDDVAQVLSDLAAKHNIAVDIPHHTRKGSADPGNAERGRGASATKDASRLTYTLTTMSAEEAKAFGIAEEERRLFMRMDSAKVNIAPPMGKAKWFKLVGVRLDNGNDEYPNGDEVQTVELWKPPKLWEDLAAATLNAALTEIDAGMPNGQRFSSAGPARDRAAWRVVQKHCQDRTEAQCREIVRIWLKNGVLYETNYDDPIERKERKGLCLDTSKRPS